MQVLESWRLMLRGRPVEITLEDVRLCLVNAAVGLEGQRDLMQVLESWRLVLRGLPMEITLEDVRVCARDGAAFVTCTEVMEAGDTRGRYALLLVPKFISWRLSLLYVPAGTLQCCMQGWVAFRIHTQYKVIPCKTLQKC